MGRYQNTKIKTNILRRGNLDNKKYSVKSLNTIVYSSIPESDGDIYVITQMGDRLDHLANQYYGDVNLWWYIAKANNLSFMTILPGIRLRIPATTEYAIGK